MVALGVFDGMHRGHSKILKAVVSRAHSIQGTSMVLTFWPDPHKQQSLYSLKHRLRLIQEAGIDACIVLKLSRQLADLTAEKFVKNILFKKIGANYVYVGKNFRFGRGREGEIKTLKKFSRFYNFRLKVFDLIRIDRQPISSTYISNLIKKGRLISAQKLLTRPVSILGRVIKGGSLAKKLGFPTANIDPHHEVIPPSGVYAVGVILNNRKLNGVCNIGTKPTFKSTGEKHIEVHIFNFQKNIYGKYLEIQFIKRIREERKFTSLSALAEQIKKDINIAQRIFSRH